MRWLYRVLRIWGDSRAASRGPSALSRRYARRQAHRSLARMLRKF